MTFTHALSTNNYGTAKFIVDASAANGTHTTIASALTSASSGDTIFIRPGTYTENLTLKAGVNLSAFVADAYTPNVIILGKATFSGTGTVSLSGIQLKTNSDFFLVVSGSSASIVYLVNCYLNMNNNTGISYTSSSSSSGIFIIECDGTFGTTGITLCVSIASGNINIERCNICYGSGNSTATSTSTAQIVATHCRFNFPFSTSSTGSLNIKHSAIECQNQNATAVTTAGTGTSSCEWTLLSSGTASAVSAGSGTTMQLYQCEIVSSNTNAITGAGTVKFGCLTFTSTSIINNATTQTNTYTNLSKSFATGQPAFLAYVNTTITNVTGDGTVYTIIYDTEVFDQDANFNLGTSTFTAPITARYQISYKSRLTGGSSVTSCLARIITSNFTYRSAPCIPIASGSPPGTTSECMITLLADMDASDTLTVTIQATDGGGKIDDVAGLGGGEANNFLSVFLAC